MTLETLNNSEIGKKLNKLFIDNGINDNELKMMLILKLDKNLYEEFFKETYNSLNKN